jgi:dienelactone hydrolase
VTSRTLPRRRLAAAILALPVLLVAPALPAAAQSPAPPSVPADLPATPPDDFYLLDPVTPGPDGELLRSVELFAPDGYRLWAILYRSRGVQDEPIAVSGLVLAPDSDPESPRPVLSIAHGTTGLADICAPSRSVDKRIEIIAAGIPAAADGWVVAATDYAGLGTPGQHPYIDGPTEGRAQLHAAIAAAQIPDAVAGTTVGLQGISQGGHSTLWAAQLAATEAPGLDVVGAVAAAPAGDLTAMADWARSGGETQDSWGNTITVARAWSDVYGLPLDQLLTPAGLEAAAALDERCRVTPDSQPLQISEAISDEWNARLEANSPGATAATMPILYLQGTDDEQIPVESARVTLERLCAAGSVVDYREIEGATHAGSLYGDDRVTEARDWLRDRIAGQAATDTCATR